jgi:hypothetical protein
VRLDLACVQEDRALVVLIAWVAAQHWKIPVSPGGAERSGAPPEDRVRVRRPLSHLVVDIGKDVADNAGSEWTFQADETLYGLSHIAPCRPRE